MTAGPPTRPPRHSIPQTSGISSYLLTPGARNLAITLLADWEGTLQEAIETAELLTAA